MIRIQNWYDKKLVVESIRSGTIKCLGLYNVANGEIDEIFLTGLYTQSIKGLIYILINVI